MSNQEETIIPTGDGVPFVLEPWDDHSRFRASCHLAIALRHRPQRLGVTLDDAGWASVEALIAGCRRQGIDLNEARLQEIVNSGAKRRFALSEDHLRMRAAHGHSVPIQIGYSPSPPPATLYHGTGQHNLDSILRQGILHRRRRYVHLSTELHRAREVGAKRGQAIVLAVDAARMHHDGSEFYATENGIWLVEHVPASILGGVVDGGEGGVQREDA